MRSSYTFLAAAAVGLGIATFGSIAPHCSRSEYEVTITGTERNVGHDREGKSTSKYIVFTADARSGEERVFENTDSFLEWKFDSSSLQAIVKKAEKTGSVCDVKAYGWRIPFLSKYENILEARCD
ncbi:DUF1523 family protein [Candidatus Woesearchaeota archaeon]|nr:DUF1523 family protein [Candidatus Woesearchaeota archaeon]